MRSLIITRWALTALVLAWLFLGFRETAMAEAPAGEGMSVSNTADVLTNSPILNLKNAKVVLSQKIFSYNGSVQKPSINSVTLGAEVLTEGTDYDVIWQNKASTNARTYKLKLAGKGRCAGSSLIARYRIDPADIDSKKLTLSANAFAYNGKVQRPSVTAVGGKKLKSGRDYSVIWYTKASKNAGIHYVRVIGKGNYNGASAIAKYKIKKASIQDTQLVLSADTFAYNGKVQRPSVLSVGGVKLIADTDYRILWSDKASKLPGTYSLKVKGIGNYTGVSVVEPYEIVLRKNTLTVTGKTAYVSAEDLAEDSLTLPLSNVLGISRAKGIVTFEIVNGNDDFVIDEALGDITLAMGIEEGTYELEINVTASGNSYYQPSTKTVSVTIVVLRQGDR